MYYPFLINIIVRVNKLTKKRHAFIKTYVIFQQKVTKNNLLSFHHSRSANVSRKFPTTRVRSKDKVPCIEKDM